MHTDLQNIIESAFERRTDLTPQTTPPDLKIAVNEVINLLDQGKIRVAEKKHNQWHTHEWIKKAVLLFFRIYDNEVISGGFTHYFDKVPLKFQDEQLKKFGIRI